MYYWSHGVCIHTSDNCNNPLPDHQANATFSNCMQGCDFYCLPINDNNHNQRINPYINSIFEHNYRTSNIIIAKGDSTTLNNHWTDSSSYTT